MGEERSFMIINSDLDLSKTEWMHMSSNSGRFLNIIWHVDGYKTVYYFIKHDESCIISAMFQKRPI